MVLAQHEQVVSYILIRSRKMVVSTGMEPDIYIIKVSTLTIAPQGLIHPDHIVNVRTT